MYAISFTFDKDTSIVLPGLFKTEKLAQYYIQQVEKTIPDIPKGALSPIVVEYVQTIAEIDKLMQDVEKMSRGLEIPTEFLN